MAKSTLNGLWCCSLLKDARSGESGSKPWWLTGWRGRLSFGELRSKLTMLHQCPSQHQCPWLLSGFTLELSCCTKSGKRFTWEQTCRNTALDSSTMLEVMWCSAGEEEMLLQGCLHWERWCKTKTAELFWGIFTLFNHGWLVDIWEECVCKLMMKCYYSLLQFCLCLRTSISLNTVRSKYESLTALFSSDNDLP